MAATPGSSEAAPASSTSSHPAEPIEEENITLHILSPSPEVTNGRLTFEDLSLNTTIARLKHHIQNAIPTAPGPERQRLIYRGHALLTPTATLRQILRPQVRKPGFT